ncbi:MAG: hypothetical protein E4H41_02985 [Gemmatimonadales bacterium]|jgi:hypothetical protein|nr:MAG: hypothetical protein E4H41_02985 [Gemmatimonadales bacterium]
MELTITEEMLAALERAADRPDWLIEQVARMRTEGAPFILPLGSQQSTALEELCAMNIRFTADGKVKPEHAALDALSILVLENS